MITKLTKEQEKQLYKFREEMLLKGYQCKEIDMNIIKEVMDEFYIKSGHDKPKYYWRCDSPLQAQLIMNFLKKALNLENTNLRANLRANLGANLRDNLGDNLWAN